MSIDISKRPAPWASDKNGYVWDADGCYVASGNDQNVADHIALARNSLDVMMRRGWIPVPLRFGMALMWGIRTKEGYDMPLAFIVKEGNRGYFADPFTALVEADKWYVANVGEAE